MKKLLRWLFSSEWKKFEDEMREQDFHSRCLVERDLVAVGALRHLGYELHYRGLAHTIEEDEIPTLAEHMGWYLKKIPQCLTPPPQQMTNYSHHSHRHCFSYGDKQPPCGIKLEDHKQCCLCDLKMPSSEKPQPMCCLKCIVPTDDQDKNYGCSNVDCICHIEQPQCPHTQTFLVTLPGGKVVERCGSCDELLPEKPQPEQWEREFGKMWGLNGNYLLRISIRDLIGRLLSRQKEQMLKVLRGMKRRGIRYTEQEMASYNVALSDVEEKWKDL